MYQQADDSVLSVDDYRWFMKTWIVEPPDERTDPEGRKRYLDLGARLVRLTGASDGQLRTAVHEAAHSVVSHRLAYHTDWIVIRDDNTGEAHQTPFYPVAQFRNVFAFAFDHATLRVAGQVAEEIGWTYARWPEDRIGPESGHNYLRLQNWPEQVSDDDRAEFRRIAPGGTLVDCIWSFIESAQHRAETILRENWESVVGIAEALRKRRQIDGPDLILLLVDVEFGNYDG